MLIVLQSILHLPSKIDILHATSESRSTSNYESRTSTTLGNLNPSALTSLRDIIAEHILLVVAHMVNGRVNLMTLRLSTVVQQRDETDDPPTSYALGLNGQTERRFMVHAIQAG